jgi:signal transduction histidine kinase
LDAASLSRHRVSEALASIRLKNLTWMQAVNLAQTGKELELKATDGRGNEFEVALAPFRGDNGDISGLIVVIEDVTQLRQAQREREDALSFLSHDIRSPQNSIMALAELQRNANTRKPASEFVADIEALAQKTVTLAEDFLQLARADSKALSLAEYDLRLLVDDGVAEIDPQARARQVAIEVSEPIDGTVVMADRALMVRAIVNLLINAVKHSETGGKVVVRCTVESGDVCCSIKDNGPGISKGDLPRLFRRYSQTDSGMAKGGAGMGLAFVDVVIRRHKGEVRVESEVGHGATFSINMPRFDPGRG